MGIDGQSDHNKKGEKNEQAWLWIKLMEGVSIFLVIQLNGEGQREQERWNLHNHQ